MAGTDDMERRDDDREAQAQARAREQENLDRIMARLEALVEQRDPDGTTTMAGDLAGDSPGHRPREQRWSDAAGEVRGIIRLMQEVMDENDAASTPRPPTAPSERTAPTADREDNP
jgi:hypothetical protein